MEEPVFIQLDIPVIGFDKSSFVEGGNRWEAKTLYDAAEELPVFDLPLAGIDLSVMPWSIKNIQSVAEHFKRVMNADLKYPVLLDNYGYICDGWHRVIKALMMGKTHIQAKRLAEMPMPDEIIEQEDNQKS